jgi:hypothetical protein
MFSIFYLKTYPDDASISNLKKCSHFILIWASLNPPNSLFHLKFWLFSSWQLHQAATITIMKGNYGLPRIRKILGSRNTANITHKETTDIIHKEAKNSLFCVMHVNPKTSNKTIYFCLMSMDPLIFNKTIYCLFNVC